MKERQRWRSEEDAVLRAYVKQYGPHEWSLVSQRMGVAFDRDAKSCLERWKNYLKPGLKKGSLTEEEQCLVIRLQAKHGNKWKKIAAEVPGRTAKRLGKWWEVFKEKQRRELEEASSKTLAEPIDQARYDHILENFAEKLVKDRRTPSLYMAAPLLQQQPPWLSSSLPPPPPPPPSSSSSSPPSVTLSLSPTSLPADGGGPPLASAVAAAAATASRPWVVSELVERCREVEEGRRAWASHRKEAAWRLKRVELQLELEKACKKKEKILEIESRVRALREEQAAAVEKIEAEFRDQLSAFRTDAELKEQKLAEQWAAKHLQLARLLDQMMGPLRRPSPDTAGP